MQHTNDRFRSERFRLRGVPRLLGISLVVLFSSAELLNGCGSGGYAGSAIPTLSSTRITIDAGQTINVSANNPNSLPLAWSLVGSSCSGSACGVLSSGSNTSVTYTAPAQLSSQLTLTLQGTLTGTAATTTSTITVNPAPTIQGTTPAGTVNQPYSATLTAAGGTGTLTWNPVSGTLPPGLSFNAQTGVISGTPTAQGNFSFSVSATDQSDVPFTVTASEQIAIGTTVTPLTAQGTPATGTVGTPYTATLQASGGTAPYAWTVLSGSLPAGLTMSPAGVIAGTPTAAGSSTFTAQVTDAAGATASVQLSITITSPQATMVISTNTLPTGTVNSPYSATLGVMGGNAPYGCTVTSGSLPAGLSFTTGCTVTGTPTTAGTSTPVITVSDASRPAVTVSGPVTIVIDPAATTPSLTLTSGSLPAGTVNVPYTSTVGVSGGTGPYTCALASGTLPAGLSFGAGCSVTGTPTTAGLSTPVVRVTDSSNPAATTTGTVAILINPAAATLTLSTGSLPAGTVNTPYSAAVGVNGGAAPYTCSVVTGTLPAGLSFGANCSVSGTPTTAGVSTPTISVTDSSNPSNNITGPIAIVINPANATLTLTNSSLPDGTVGMPYTATVGVTGGTGPFSCTVESGALPAGLTFGTNCSVTGTPTTAGTSTPVIRIADSTNPNVSLTTPIAITIDPVIVTLNLTSPPAGTVNVPYAQPITVTGGTAPYTCALAAGTLPAGLTLGANCQITGTPTAAGTTAVSVKATDSSSPAEITTGAVTLVINAPSTTLTVGNPPPATLSTPYTGVIPVTGGTAPYTCAIASGNLPAGLTLGANCTVTGTPTVTGSSTANITVTDSANPALTTTAPVTITVQPIAPLTLTGSLPNATLGVAYSQTLHASGGLAPYTYAVTAGALPAGLQLSSAGVISGTPTAVGASSFTITATDSEGTPQTASLPLLLLVTYPTTPQDALLKGPYAFLFQGYDDVVAGVLAYQTATIGSFNADGTGVLTTGELDSNHQDSNPTGNTVANQGLVGTYTLGADGRGTLAMTALNSDGTTAATTTYAIALKLPTAPATTSTSGSLIESDGNQLVGTKGSGTLLAQTAGAFSNGLNGSYAFGLSGDTPCLPSCTIGLVAGPVASVGQITVNAGTITGTGDTNVGATNYASSTLGGSAAPADNNGRVQLNLTTSRLNGLPYPTDYAVYIVDANHAFVMSTDKHSAYVLQAGTAELQTQSTFSNSTSLNAPFVGYENSAVNPGLVSTTLTNVLNLSSATVFRGTGNGNGTCTTTNVDVGGLTGLVNSLTGLGGNSALLNAVLGTYQSLGNSNCTVAANGRTVLNYPNPDTILSATLALLGLGSAPPPARVVYLSAPNQGYFLETGYAGLGRIEAQTGAPFTVGSLNGSYVYGTIPASTLATVDGSGSFTADGSGHATTTLDTNVGVGTLNILDLGVTGSTTYTLTDAAAGRYLLGGTRVVYAIAPGRYVLIDTDALNTSPFIALLF